MKKIIERDINKAGFYHFYPTTVAIVLVKYEHKINGMAVAWNCAFSFQPPLFGVAIAPKRYSYELIKKSKEFSVNFLPSEYSYVVAGFGRLSGRDFNKIQKLNVEVEDSLVIKTPVLKISYSAYECKVVNEFEVGDHILVIGEVVAVHYLKSMFDTPKKTPDFTKIKPILYLGKDIYFKIKEFQTEVIDEAKVKDIFKIKPT